MEIRKQIMTRSRDTAPESGSSSPLLRSGGGAGGGQYNAVSLFLFFLVVLVDVFDVVLARVFAKIAFSCSTVESEGSML